MADPDENYTVVHLRAAASNSDSYYCNMLDDAADEIERLQTKLEQAQQAISDLRRKA